MLSVKVPKLKGLKQIRDSQVLKILIVDRTHKRTIESVKFCTKNVKYLI